MPISDPPSHRTKWLLMKCLKLQPTLSCLLILTQHRHCSRESLQLDLTWKQLSKITKAWYTHISHLPHKILYICVIFGHGKWWKVDETERTPWSVAAGCDFLRGIINLWIQQSAGNVLLVVWQTALYLYALTSNTMLELIIESNKNVTIIVLRSGCEQQCHTYLDQTWQPQNHVT